jgi:hypothetical protein
LAGRMETVAKARTMARQIRFKAFMRGSLRVI